MGAKTISVSSDDTTYYTLPGNTGNFSDDLGTLDDTIFGQTYKSMQPNLVSWKVTANALYKGFAGYLVNIKQTGTAITMTAEAMSLVSGKTYKTTAVIKNIWDRATAITVYDNAVDQTANVLSIDHLFGQVTFKPAYTVTGPVTVTGKYLPATVLAKYQKFSLTQSMDPINNSDIPTLQANQGQQTYDFGLRTVGLEVSGIYASTNGYRAALLARSEVIIEINPDGSSLSVARGFFRPAQRKQDGKVGALEEETMNWNLTVPDQANVVAPFEWQFATATTLSLAVQKCLLAYQNNTNLYVKYLPDGATGFKGSGLVSDFSLSGGMDAMNEFSVTIQGSGAITII